MRAHIVGGGFGGLAAAALLIRNAGLSGADITIYEADERMGGGFFPGGSAETGYNLPSSVRRGWEVVEQYSDAGISGAKGRDGRPGLDQMLKDAGKHHFDVVMSWAIDRLGRSLIDLFGTIQTLEACSVDLYLDQHSIDTTTPAGKLI
jgi:glycine/D-amino acid oxidase-like deaminating enzyme